MECDIVSPGHVAFEGTLHTIIDFPIRPHVKNMENQSPAWNARVICPSLPWPFYRDPGRRSAPESMSCPLLYMYPVIFHGFVLWHQGSPFMSFLSPGS